MESPVKDVIEVLKLRLARGEITVTEYKEILKTVGEVEDEIFNENFEEQASGDTSLTNTGKQIAEVDELQVCEHCFFYKSARYEFSSVRRVHGNRSTFSVNFVPMFKNTYLTVLFDNNQEITLREERAYFGGNRHKKIDNALQALRRITYNLRLEKTILALRNDGKLILYKPIFEGDETKEIYLTTEGVIHSSAGSFDIKEAKENGTFGIGTEYSSLSGMSYDISPSEVVVSYKRPLIKGRIPKGALKFIPYMQDSDVILPILDWLAQPNNNIESLNPDGLRR